MFRTASILAASVSVLALSGCGMQGTTYGTGVSHERATMNSFRDLFNLRAKRPEQIDYSPRPELVMPSTKETLPAPMEGEGLGADGNWPVEPEQRISAIRNEAPKPDEYGNLPQTYLQSEKAGIRRNGQAIENRRSNVRSGAETFIQEIRDEANGQGVSEEVKRRREQLSYSSGVKRRFLTEPPSEYRQPAQTAEAGETGITSDEVKREINQARAERRASDNRTILPGEN